MKSTEKLEKSFQEFMPHINGHKSAIDLFHEGMSELKKTEEQAKQALLGLRGLIWAYEHRNDDMSHISGHPGSEAFLNAKMNMAKDFLKKSNIEELLK